MIQAISSFTEAITKPFKSAPKAQIHFRDNDLLNYDKLDIKRVDESCDGRFSWGEAGKNFVKGLVSPITNMFSSPKNFLIGAAMIAGGVAVCALGGAPLLIAAGVTMGAFQAGSAAYKAITAKNGDGVEKAFYDAGAATTTLGLSALGARAALRSTGVNTQNMSVGQAIVQSYKQVPAKFSALKAKFGFTGKAAAGSGASTVSNAKALPPGPETKALPAPKNTTGTSGNTTTTPGTEMKALPPPETTTGTTGKTPPPPPKTPTGGNANTVNTAGASTVASKAAPHVSRINAAKTADVSTHVFKHSQIKNPYEVLNIPKDATAAQIKASYRQLAQLFHPDKNPAGRAFFDHVQASYDILNNPSLRFEVNKIF